MGLFYAMGLALVMEGFMSGGSTPPSVGQRVVVVGYIALLNKIEYERIVMTTYCKL